MNCFQTAFVNGYGLENKDEEPPWCAGDSAYTLPAPHHIAHIHPLRNSLSITEPVGSSASTAILWADPHGGFRIIEINAIII